MLCRCISCVQASHSIFIYCTCLCGHSSACGQLQALSARASLRHHSALSCSCGGSLGANILCLLSALRSAVVHSSHLSCVQSLWSASCCDWLVSAGQPVLIGLISGAEGLQRAQTQNMQQHVVIMSLNTSQLLTAVNVSPVICSLFYERLNIVCHGPNFQLFITANKALHLLINQSVRQFWSLGSRKSRKS